MGNLSRSLCIIKHLCPVKDLLFVEKKYDLVFTDSLIKSMIL